ncbi:MAG: hypothetical protein FJY20_09250 [Bacteroidetes bacterium]|nr:hypothetical protein [Bacteroidota bacterium]
MSFALLPKGCPTEADTPNAVVGVCDPAAEEVVVPLFSGINSWRELQLIGPDSYRVTKDHSPNH